MRRRERNSLLSINIPFIIGEHMNETDKTRIRDMAIARLAKFIDNNLHDIDWTITAQSCGVLDVLNQPFHERVQRAQSWGDSDYVTAVAGFLRDVFSTDGRIGLALVGEIIADKTFSEPVKAELDRILSMFGARSEDLGGLLRTIQIPASEKFLEVTSVPDDFYRKLIDEINFLYALQHPMSIRILVRKLLENLVIDILRKKYSKTSLALFYDPARGRFHDFSVLIANLDQKKGDFQYITKELNTAFMQKINKYRETGNSGAHSLDAKITVAQLTGDKDEINYIVQLLGEFSRVSVSRHEIGTQRV